MAFNPREICTLTVNGQIFQDWKSITVYLCQQEANNYYRFTVSEGRPLVKVWKELQIRPGMQCDVTLGGQWVIGGFVTTRQVAYTEKSHGIEITGKSRTYATVNGAASVKGGEITNKSFQQASNDILAPYGLTMITKGGVDQSPFDRVNVTGQTAWEVIEGLARQRKVILGPNPNDGNSFYGTTHGYTEGQASLEEGVNILEGRETLSMEFGSGAYLSMAQAAPTPQKWGPEITNQLGQFGSQFAQNLGVGSMFMPLINMAEMPGKQADADSRSGSENGAVSGEQIKVECVIQGWFLGGQLPKPWMQIHVKSPMLIMDQDLICKSVTFTQDDRSGTRTTIELWNEVGKAGPSLG